MAQAHDPGQALGASVDEGHAPAAIDHAEGGAAYGDTEVAPAGQLEAACEAIAVDGGDGWLGKIGDAADAHGAALAHTGPRDQAVQRLQIGPSAVPAEGLDCIVQQPGCLAVHRVADVGPVDRDDQGATPALGEDFGHGGTSRRHMLMPFPNRVKQ